MEGERSTILQWSIYALLLMVRWLLRPFKGKSLNISYYFAIFEGFCLFIFLILLAWWFYFDSLQGIMLLNCNISAKSLSIAKVSAL